MSKGAQWHISSAVVMTKPGSLEPTLASLAQMPGVEVHGHASGKIIVVIEGEGPNVLGDRLHRISLLDGVISANMVFEHVEREENQDVRRTEPT
ncbi:chaperone NapD [Rhizobium sp. P32RR-XVIII]|uniref:chaperone NapD n=1 Tax=Rhizobium sp. P32RR-XVIII TaxID=2726738 RepID=UPI0019806516|nr:chaperone NapD [Rhizobium sp. P32RR-XVIII]